MDVGRLYAKALHQQEHGEPIAAHVPLPRFQQKEQGSVSALGAVAEGISTWRRTSSMLGANSKEAPAWNGNALAGHRVLRVAAKPLDVLVGLSNFFGCVVEAEVEECKEVNSEAAWSIRATAFLDYVALGVEVSVYREVEHAVVVFKHTTQQDIVRFTQLVSLAIEHLRSLKMDAKLITPGVTAERACCTFDCLDDDFAEEFPPAGQESWPQLISSILGDLVGGAAKRREALQTIAQWAETREDCRGALADALRQPKHSSSVKALFQGSKPAVEEIYPLAAAVRFACFCPAEIDASAGLVSMLLPLPWPKDLPKIVVGQLTKALNRQGAGQFKKPGNEQVLDFPSGASTMYTDTLGQRFSFEMPSDEEDDDGPDDSLFYVSCFDGV